MAAHKANKDSSGYGLKSFHAIWYHHLLGLGPPKHAPSHPKDLHPLHISFYAAVVFTVVLNASFSVSSFPPHAGTFAVLVMFSKITEPLAF